MSSTPKPGIDELLVRSALDPGLRRRLLQSPSELLSEFDLTDEETDILLHPDERMLDLLGNALRRQGHAALPDSCETALRESTPLAVEGNLLPDLRLVVTVVPCAVAKGSQSFDLTFAAWVDPLPAGVDPAALPAPAGTSLPGRPLAPLRAVLNVSTQQLAASAGMPQVGLTASLMQAGNISAPPEPALAATSSHLPQPASPDIWIVGLGVQTAAQVTREVEQAIRASREVLYVDTGVATRALLSEWCPHVTSLYEESYREEHSRTSAYDHMAEQVIRAARDHAPVTFALHGHPLIAAVPPFRVIELARAQGLSVSVLPGVSSIDTIMADLRIDPVVHGIQMYEATDLLLRRRPLQPDVPALIWQIGPLETCLHTMRVSRPERFARFISHLLMFYPPAHEVVAIHCAPHPLMPPATLRCAIQDFAGQAASIHGGFSLYIPPLHTRPIHDYDLLRKLYQVEHLREITGTPQPRTP